MSSANPQPYLAFVDRDWFSQEETRRILRQTWNRIPAKKRPERFVDPAGVCPLLNEIANDGNSAQLSKAISRDEWLKFARLAGQIKEYALAGERLRQSGFAVQRVDDALLRDAARWQSEIKEVFAAKAPRHDPWERAFYPRMLGLYPRFPHPRLADLHQPASSTEAGGTQFTTCKGHGDAGDRRSGPSGASDDRREQWGRRRHSSRSALHHPRYVPAG